MLVGAGKNPVQPGLVPLGTVKEHGSHAGTFGSDDVGGGVPHIPGTGVWWIVKPLYRQQQLVWMGFAQGGIIAAYIHIKQMGPAGLVHRTEFMLKKLPVPVGDHP